MPKNGSSVIVNLSLCNNEIYQTVRLCEEFLPSGKTVYNFRRRDKGYDCTIFSKFKR